MSINLKSYRRIAILLIVTSIVLGFYIFSPAEWQDRYIRPLHEFLLLLATVILAWATFVLAEHTKMINEREKDLRRFQDLQRCITLAEIIIRPPADMSLNLIQGTPTSDAVRPFSDLLTLSKHFHDSDTKRQLEFVTSELTGTLLSPRERASVTPGEPLTDNLSKLRPRLVQEIIEWQRQLGNYSIK